MIRLISITGWLASWLSLLPGRCGLTCSLAVCGCGLADWLWLAGWLAGWLAVADWLVGYIAVFTKMSSAQQDVGT